MQKAPFIHFLLVSFLFFTSCENEIDVAAEWQEIPIIYGLLDCNQDTNYIRIQKAYLDDKQSALLFSNIPDSIYFEKLEVKVIEYINGNETAIWDLPAVNGEDFGINKDSGDFSKSPNILYQLVGNLKLSSFVNRVEYKLFVTNPKNGKRYEAAQTAAGISILTLPVNKDLNFLVIDGREGNSIPFKYNEGFWVRGYSGNFVCHIEEYNSKDSSLIGTKKLIWRAFENNRTVSFNGNSEGRINVPSETFLRFLKGNLDENNLVYRKFVNFDVDLYAFDDEFNTFLSVIKPAQGIIQKKPEYTNISNNGYGIFANRTITTVGPNKLSDRSLNLLKESEITKSLNFVK